MVTFHIIETCWLEFVHEQYDCKEPVFAWKLPPEPQPAETFRVFIQANLTWLFI